MNIPNITSIDNALEIYYRYPEIGTKEITQLFSKHSKSTIAKLKKAAYQQMVIDDVYSHSLHKLNTASCYKAWGLDVDDLEKRRNKLQKLGL